MFFKKSREAKAKMLEEDRKQVAKLRTALAKAEAEQDPGQKLLLLDDLHKDITEQAKDFSLKRRKSRGFIATDITGTAGVIAAGIGTGIGTAIGIGKTAAAIGIVLQAPFLLPSAVVGLATVFGLSKLVGAPLLKAAGRRYDKKRQELLDTLNELGPKVGTLRMQALEADLDTLASSKNFDALYDRIPALKERFLKETFRQEPHAPISPSPPRKPGFNA